MRIFDLKKCKLDKNYLFAFIIAIICSIICGIVLFKISNLNIYFYNYAEIYVYNVFIFNNGALFFPHLLAEIFYLYIFLCISKYTKLKYLTLIALVIRTVFASIYCAVLLTMCGISGITVCLIVYLPCILMSLAACFCMAQFHEACDKRYILFLPCLVSVLLSIVYLLFVNLLFRIIIVLV